MKEYVPTLDSYLVTTHGSFCLLTILESALSFFVSLQCLEEPEAAWSLFSDNPLRVSIHS